MFTLSMYVDVWSSDGTVNMSAGSRSSAEAGAPHSASTCRQQRRTRASLPPGDAALSMPSNSAQMTHYSYLEFPANPGEERHRCRITLDTKIRIPIIGARSISRNKRISIILHSTFILFKSKEKPRTTILSKFCNSSV